MEKLYKLMSQQDIDSKVKKEVRRYKKEKLDLYKDLGFYEIKRQDLINKNLIEHIRFISGRVNSFVKEQIDKTSSRKRLTIGKSLTIRRNSVYIYNSEEEANIRDIISNIGSIKDRLSENHNSKKQLGSLNEVLAKLRHIHDEIINYYEEVEQRRTFYYNTTYLWLKNSKNSYTLYRPGYIQFSTDSPKNNTVRLKPADQNRVFPIINEENREQIENLIQNRRNILSLTKEYYQRLKDAFDIIRNTYIRINPNANESNTYNITEKNINQKTLVDEVNYKQ